MITLYYNELNKELKDKIENHSLTDEELINIKYTLEAYPKEFKKPKKKANIFALVSIISLLSILATIFIFMGSNPLIPVEPGSDLAKMIVFILIGVFILFLLSIICAAVFSLKYLPHVYLNSMYKLMTKHYPKEIESLDL